MDFLYNKTVANFRYFREILTFKSTFDRSLLPIRILHQNQDIAIGSAVGTKICSNVHQTRGF